MIEIYTDGSCLGNGKENTRGGAVFVVLKDGNKYYQEQYSSRNVTNQKMELLAVATAYEYLKRMNIIEPVTIISDSAYIINCYNQKWWANWQKNGWKNAKKQPVANKDLWERIIPAFQDQNIQFKKISGHTGQIWNEYADRTAVWAASTLRES